MDNKTVKLQFSGSYLWHLIFPLLISTMLASAVGIVDTLMISSLSESCISGVSLVDQINVLLINVFAALATGGAVVTSQLLGAGKDETAHQSAKQLIVSGFVISLFLTVLLIALNHAVISVCFPKVDAETREAATIYFYITALSYPFIAVENCCGALFRSFGKSNYCMYSAIIGNLFNIVGNAIMIYLFKTGVAGAAISTTVSRGISMVMMLIWISGKKSPLRLKLFERFRPDFKLIARILHIGIPNGLENGVFQLGRLLVVRIIAEYDLTQTTANAVANNLDSFGCIFGSAMNLAVITIIGQCVGAQDFAGVKYYAKKLLMIEYAVGALFYASTILFIHPILGWYHLSPETAALTRTLVLMHNGIGAFLWPLAFTLPNFLRAANDVRYTMVVSIASMVIFRIGLSYFFHYTFALGAIGVWIGMIVDWIVRLSFFLVRFLRGSWRKYCT